MKMELPEQIAAYYAAKNDHNVESMLAAFTEHAIVRDEGKDHTGRDAIRMWMTETTRRYRVNVTPKTVTRSGAQICVDALVTGNFPGSPARLTYKFELANDGISALEIG